MQQSDTVQSDVDVYVKRTINNTSEDKHCRRYHLGEEEEKTEAEMDWLYQSRHESYPDAYAIRTTKDEVCDRTIIFKWGWVEDENGIVLF